MVPDPRWVKSRGRKFNVDLASVAAAHMTIQHGYDQDKSMELQRKCQRTEPT